MRNVALTTLIGLLMGAAAQAQTDAPPDLPADAGASPQTPAARADEPASVPDFDAAALALADQTDTQASSEKDWHARVEGAVIESASRDGTSSHMQRLSMDTTLDKTFGSSWRLMAANRLDLTWRGDPSYDDFTNTLKEAYLSWQPRSDTVADLGRVNLRHGAAIGYNPTDYFKVGAVRSVVSISPESLRENRLGSVMLRGQRLWNTGSLTALYSPELTDRPNRSPFSPDFGSTNNQDRWMLVLSQKLTRELNPQILLYDDERDSPQIGLNVSMLVNDATVAFLEWSGGDNSTLISQALGQPDDSSFRSRLATGFTYTAPNKLSLTLEYQYNGAAPDEDDWEALRQGSVDVYRQYRAFAQLQQDLPTRQNAFLYARWEDVVLNDLDLNGMLRLDTNDDSRLSWIEARYHWDKIDLALQWQYNKGDALTQYGALEPQQRWHAVLTYYH